MRFVLKIYEEETKRSGEKQSPYTMRLCNSREMFGCTYLHRFPVGCSLLLSRGPEILDLLRRLAPDPAVDEQHAEPDEREDGRDDSDHVPRVEDLIELALLRVVPLVPDDGDGGDGEAHQPTGGHQRQSYSPRHVSVEWKNGKICFSFTKAQNQCTNES